MYHALTGTFQATVNVVVISKSDEDAWRLQNGKYA